MDFGVPIAVRGTLTFNITDYREFIKLHRLIDFDLEAFKAQVKDAAIKYTKDVVANIPAEKNIPVVQIERQITLVSDTVEEAMKNRLHKNFGVNVTGVDVGTIEVDKDSNGYMELKKVTQDADTATVQAQTEAGVKNIHDMQRITAENMQESLRIQREEGQYAQRKQTQTGNFAAYQVEAQTQVGVAGADALGKMGASGGGDMSGGGGLNPATMMAGMAIGGALGQNIAGTMNNMMSGVNQPQQAAPPPSVPPSVPPPIPVSEYNVVINGQSLGPFNIAVLTQMVMTGTFTREILVWKTGMPDWAKAGTVGELQGIFSSPPPVPPIPPTE